MIEADHKRLQLLDFDQIPERERRVLAAGKRDNAVILLLATKAVEDAVEFSAAFAPIDLRMLVFDLPTNRTHALLVERQRFSRLRHQTMTAIFHRTSFGRSMG